jgi:digeranylgeranylglycerophospholipid reductase
VSGYKGGQEACHFYFGKNIAPGGYVWIFPKSEGVANIGIGISGHLAADKGPKEYLDEFMEREYPDVQVNYIAYGGVPTAWGLEKYIANNIMLVGDAARQVNPITGGGIVQGMIAGQIAGDVAAAATEKGDFSYDFLKSYQKRWDARLGSIQKTMYAMKERFMKMDDEHFNKLVRICQKIPHDEFSLKRLFSESMKGDPVLVAQIAKAFVVSKLNLKKI